MKSAVCIPVLFMVPLLANGSDPSWERGEIVPPGTYPPAYNASAQITLNKEDSCIPQLFVETSFLYFHANEEGLDLATSGGLVDGIGSYKTVATGNAIVASQGFDYKPGFQIGLGGTFREWSLGAEYTWIRQTVKTSKHAPTPDIAGALGVWVVDNWFQQTAPDGQGISAFSLDSKWHLKMDLLDLMLSRPFYEGRRITISPAFGLRAAWIGQSLHLDIEIPTEVIASQVSTVTNSYNSSRSWGLGPRASLDADCLLGMGFRFQGEIALSLLFAKYMHVFHEEDVATVGAVPSTLKTSYPGYTCLRGIGELNVGFGWGSYLYKDRYHIDFSASYNFWTFLNQNMIRRLMDQTVSGSGASAGNLYLQGMELRAAFEF